ncbi:MAG TPA: hypothetical protein VF160_08820 [Candidatus Dormibacteraeota bacterium]
MLGPRTNPRFPDLDRTLPGESEETKDPEDAAHWIAVYTELLDTTHQLIANIRELMERQPQDVQDKLERTDLRLLELQAQRFERRIAVWRAKLHQVAS